jgi:NitT/TauT family transport system substrate-binding protein
LKRQQISGILLLFLGVISLACLNGCDVSQSKTKAAQVPDKLVISTHSGDYSALFRIAENQGYFSSRGVEVNLESQESGVVSLKNLLSRKADLATVSEFVFVNNIAEHPELRVLSVVAQTRNIRLIARKDHDINKIQDLKNKRIGVVRSSAADYFLHLFLMFHGILPDEIQVVDLTPSEQIKSITEGEVDAAIVWAPFARDMENALGENGVSWPAQSGQDYYWLLIATESTLNKRSSAIKKMMSALDASDDFVHNNRDETQRILASELGTSHTPEIWKDTDFDLTLSRPFILAMEAEFRWMKSSQRVQEFKMPDLLDFVHFDALQAVRPEKVHMLH